MDGGCASQQKVVREASVSFKAQKMAATPPRDTRFYALVRREVSTSTHGRVKMDAPKDGGDPCGGYERACRGNLPHR